MEHYIRPSRDGRVPIIIVDLIRAIDASDLDWCYTIDVAYQNNKEIFDNQLKCIKLLIESEQYKPEYLKLFHPRTIFLAFIDIFFELGIKIFPEALATELEQIGNLMKEKNNIQN